MSEQRKNPKGAIDLERWTSALLRANNVHRTEEPLPGFFTVRQVSEQTGQTPETTGRKMRILVKRGLAESRTFRILVGGGFRTYPVEHFRLKDPSELSSK
jgi:hypothetical protein